MEIQCIENTSFLIKNHHGKRILLDPIQLTSTIKKYDFKSDIITLSHNHNYENINFYTSENCKIIDSVCTFSNDFISLQGYNSFKDSVHGVKRGKNIIYNIEVDNIRICHLGTLGHRLDNDLIDTLKGMDFLFIPIGGHFCLDGLSASKLALSLNPKFIIPMFYKTCSKYIFLDGPYKFISSLKNITPCKSNILKTEDLNPNSSNQVILLSSIV